MGSMMELPIGKYAGIVSSQQPMEMANPFPIVGTFWQLSLLIKFLYVFVSVLKSNDPHPTSLAYAGPISHWVPICKQQPILWEVEDFYQKQTYRNRMEIHAANGKLMLSIPIQHLGYDGHQNYKDVQIANEFPWQRNHWLSLKTAYQSSPFFEYYEDDIAPLYQDRFEFLLAFNIQVMKTICELLQIQAPQETTKIYEKDSPHHDLRHLIGAKTTRQQLVNTPKSLATKMGLSLT